MDFFTTNYSHNFAAPFFITIVAGLVIFLFTVDLFKSNKSFFIYLFTYITSFIIISAVVFSIGISTRDRLAEEFQKDVNDAYGISLPSKAIWELNYPDKEPIADTQIFGSYIKGEKENNELELKEVTLVWTDHEYRLFETNEDNTIGTELPRK